MTTTLLISPPLAPTKSESPRHIPWRYRPLIHKIQKLEAQFSSHSDRHFQTLLQQIRETLRENGSPDKHLPTIFALVSVAARRHLHMRPYPVQLIGGLELHRGRIAEMATGEGKTLVATLPATLNAITGKGVHIVTVNDYLARRDAESMRPLYESLGLSLGIIVSDMDDESRRRAYRADVIYGTNKEFGFDYLRDQIKRHEANSPRPLDTLALLNRRESTQPVMRQLHYAIIDEADSILIDESRTPIIVAGQSGPSPLAWAYEWAHTLSARFLARHDFEFEPQQHKLDWKESGLQRLQKILAGTNTPSITGASWQNLIQNALRARHLFTKERNYVLAGDEVVIVDEFTGRRMPGRTWSEGLHQAVQAKEHLPVTSPSETLARTTYQHFFSLYEKLAGMTGTAATERGELRSVYHLPVVGIPTHRPLKRRRLPDRIFRTVREKWHAVAREVQHTRQLGQPVLVGTSSIGDSEALSRVLTRHDIPHQVLNARPENAQREAEIVAHAGELHAVTIATNMAGRGTDIRLGPGVAELGGLYVIGTQRHESRRVDNQLVGRSGRQGDPGAAVFMLSLEDPLLQHVLSRRQLIRLRRRASARAHAYGKPLNSHWLRLLFARAQRKVESLHFRQRQQLMEYEDWLNRVYYQMGTT